MRFLAAFAVAVAALLNICTPTHAQRVLGLDISAWQGNISQTTWNNIRNVENRQFVIFRSSRGGTTGYYDQNNSDNNPPTNTLSQRYDDPYYVQNVNRATTAGIFVGSYHFTRPDVIASTLNANGIPNNGTDEADHFIQMAGAFMRPGYLMPVHDFEAGDGIRTDDELTQYCLDFSNRIYNVMGIRPAIYTNGNYNANILQTASAALRNQIPGAYPQLWSARWPNQADPNSIDVQNAQPKDSYAGIYGPWDDGGVTHPWTFWQYASTGRLPSFNNGGSNLDMDVTQGDIEFLKDQLVPALWTNDNSGDWSTLANWNSGQAPIVPVPGPGQVAPVGTQTLPTPRLPGAAGSGVTSGQYDTVVLDRPNANITVNVSSGTHSVRKLYSREALNISGGSLTVNYDPNYYLVTDPNNAYPNAVHSGPISAQFSAPVSLSGGSFSAHTLQVDAGQIFTVSGGALTLNTINLAGTMSISNPAFDSIGTVLLSTGASLALNYSGTPDAVTALYINGVAQAAGTWGAVGSGAQHTSPFITGTGLLEVGQFVPPTSGPGNVIDDFEIDEGHFNWQYNFSPVSQTFGLSSGPANASGPTDRVTTVHQGPGTASELLNLTATTPTTSWQMRFLSGIGQAAQPPGNVPLVGDGYVGFWLKTDDAGITVRIGIDDPVGGNTALERGVAQDVISDNQWHLYQWNFDDNAQWQAFAGGANSVIDAANGTVTIDSIWFTGTGDAQIYLDTVSHNPLGMLAAVFVAGDYNYDGSVGLEDYAAWAAAFGQTVAPGTGADGNGDGVVDSGDYAIWRDHMTAAASGSSLASVPERSSISLMLLAMVGLLTIRRSQRSTFA